jgi:hypothetical protein
MIDRRDIRIFKSVSLFANRRDHHASRIAKGNYTGGDETAWLEFFDRFDEESTGLAPDG